MKNHVRLFVLISSLFLFALALPFNLAAQQDEDLETLAVGDTVERVRSEAEYLLDAQEGQTVTFRWDGTVLPYDSCPDRLFSSTIDVQTELTNADGERLPQIDLLYQKDATIEAYGLEGTPPYRLSSTLCGGSSISLTVLDGNTIPHNQQPALSIGDRLQIAGSSIQEGELVVFPLDVQEGDVFTVNTHYLNSTLLHDNPMYFAVVRDGSGQIVPSDFRGRFRGDWAATFPVYTVTGALPYRLDFAALVPEFSNYTPTGGEITSDISFSAQLLAGNTVLEDGGLVAPGSRLDVTLPDFSSARFYTLDVEDGAIVTLHSEFRMDSALYETFWDGNGEPVDPISMYAPNGENGISVGVAVYQLDGPQPYTLLFSGQGSYTLLVDAGDTLERNELGTLAPGGVIQGIKPPFDDVIDFIALDVDPAATVTLNWNVPGTAYLVQDGTGNWMDFLNADPVTDQYGIINLSRGTPPFSVIIAEPAGEPYTLTLAEGNAPLSPDDATEAALTGSAVAPSESMLVQCEAGSITILSDAFNVEDWDGSVAHVTTTSVADAAAFYEEQMAVLGGEVTSSIVDGIGLLTVRQEDHVISVSITPVDDTNNGVVITSVSMNPLVPPGDCAVSEPANSQSETASETSGAACTVSTASNANRRSGPGTNFELAGTLTSGASADVDGQATGADGFVWWRLGEGVWVRSDVVDEVGECEAVPTVQP